MFLSRGSQLRRLEALVCLFENVRGVESLHLNDLFLEINLRWEPFIVTFELMSSVFGDKFMLKAILSLFLT